MCYPFTKTALFSKELFEFSKALQNNSKQLPNHKKWYTENGQEEDELQYLTAPEQYSSNIHLVRK